MDAALRGRIGKVPAKFAHWVEHARGTRGEGAHAVAAEIKAEMEEIGMAIESITDAPERARAQNALNGAVSATLRETPQAALLIAAATGAEEGRT